MAKMITINLLDWREARREARKRRFLLALGAAALASAGVLLITLSGFNQAIENQNQRNRFLEQEIAKIDDQIEEIRRLERMRDSLITRMRIIEELQQARSQIVHYFDQVVATLPDGVYLTSLKQNGDTTTVNGVAESNGRVSAYMVNLDDSPWFDDPQLVVIKSASRDQRRLADFTLTFKSVMRKDEDAKSAEAKSDGTETRS
jgi:type IV pilus assembly protein PilN